MSTRYPETFPEERIQWRHESKHALDNYNRVYNNERADIFVDRVRRSKERQVQYPREIYLAEFLPERIWKLGSYDIESQEERRGYPDWDDLVDYRTAIEQDVGLSDRTITFFRNLAYRMGRTIRHYEEIRNRITANRSSFFRHHLDDAVDKWTNQVHQGLRTNPANLAAHPFKSALPSQVIQRAQPDHPMAHSDDVLAVFTAIRHGIIDDAVQNRTMLYPGRAASYTDRRKFVGEVFERENIWSWASEPIRKYHAVYRRERYFDVRRWPVNRQTEARQKIITSRLDEDLSSQPVSAWYKYGVRVGPVTHPTAVLSSCDWCPAVVNADLDSLDPAQQDVAWQVLTEFSKSLAQSLARCDPGPSDKWGFQIIPPEEWYDKEPVEPKLEKITRPNSIFIPGKPRFPMGDTLLNSLAISQDIEKGICHYPFCHSPASPFSFHNN